MLILLFYNFIQKSPWTEKIYIYKLKKDNYTIKCIIIKETNCYKNNPCNSVFTGETPAYS